MKTKKLWKTTILLVVALAVLMTAVSVTAIKDGETETSIQRDNVNDAIASDSDDIIDPPSDDEPDGSSWTPDYDPNLCIGITSDKGEADSDEVSKDQTLMTAGVPIFGAIIGVAMLAASMIIYKRKN